MEGIMIKQDWMTIVAGEKLVDEMTAETKSRCEFTGYGYNSSQLCVLQREQAAKGIVGCEIVVSNYGCSVRYDSGLQNFGLLASARSKDVDGTLEDAIKFANAWVAKDPTKRYAWYRNR
jgi:hypothetical protein